MKALTLTLVILSVFVGGTTRAGARSPSTQPGVGVVAYAGSSRLQLQNAMNLAASRGTPLVIDAGSYAIDKPLVVPGGLTLAPTAPRWSAPRRARS
jgi:hypothetical protein